MRKASLRSRERGVRFLVRTTKKDTVYSVSFFVVTRTGIEPLNDG